MLVLAVPGLVIALSFTYVTEHFLSGSFYQTSPLLVLAYTIMFFPLAVVSVRAAVARSPVGPEEVFLPDKILQALRTDAIRQGNELSPLFYFLPRRFEKLHGPIAPPGASQD